MVEDELAEAGMCLLDRRFTPKAGRERYVGVRVALVREPISFTSL